MKLSGTDADIDAFKQMMSGGMTDSPTMRNLLTEIGSETDPKRAFDVNLGHDQRKVLIDSFKSKALDLNDMNALPSAHDAQLPRNSITREDQIAHILAERRAGAKVEAAARDAKRPPPSDPTLFAAAHASGLRTQNAYRAERGQAAVTNTATDEVAGTDTTISRYEMADGTEEYIHAIHAGTIDKIIPPGPRLRP